MDNLTKCFAVDDGGLVRRGDHTEVMERWRAGDGPFWIHVDGTAPEARPATLLEAGLEEKSVDQMLEPGHAARILALGGGLFLEVPLMLSGRPPEMKSISFICVERLVVTLGGRMPGAFDWTDAEVLSKVVGRMSSTSELARNLLVALSVNLRRRCSAVRERAAALLQSLDEDAGTVTPNDILALKREIVDLEAVTDDRAAMMEMLSSLTQPYFDVTTVGGQFSVALGNTTAASRRIDRLERRAADLQLRYDSCLQERMNRRLSRLTIISAIFLPLTLIAGIYGMNFDVMPELHHPVGYPIALGSMVLVGIGMVWWFLALGWME